MPIAKRGNVLSRKRARKRKQQAFARRNAADLLSKVAGGRARIWPPRALLEAAGLPHTLSAVAELNAPHWEGIREMLGVDGSGYLSVVKLLERVERQVEDAIQVAQEAWDSASTAREVQQVIEAEVTPTEAEGDISRDQDDGLVPGGFDLDATLAESLGWPSIADRPDDALRKWRWEICPASESMYEHYRLRLLDPVTGSERPLPPELSEFLPDATWESVELGVFVAEAHASIAAKTDVAEEVMRWRCELIRAVVYEFELFGSVGPAAKSRRPNEQRLSPVEADFVRAAMQLKSDPIQTRANTSRKDWLETIAYELDLKLGPARRIAESIGAYRSREGVGRGRLGRDVEEKELHHFWFVIEALSDLAKY